MHVYLRCADAYTTSDTGICAFIDFCDNTFQRDVGNGDVLYMLCIDEAQSVVDSQDTGIHFQLYVTAFLL